MADNTHAHAASNAPVAPPPGPATTAPPVPPAPPAPQVPPTGSGRKRRDGRKRRGWWGFLVNRGTELLAAILTLVAAVLGIWGAQLNNENDELSDRVDSLQDDGSVLREDNASLTEDLADLTTSRDSWKTRAEEAEKALAEAEGSTSSTTVPESTDPDDVPGNQTPGAAGVFRQTGDQPVTFASGYGIRLDTRDVNWAVNTSGGDLFFHRSGVDYRLSVGTNTIALVDHEATYDECDAQTVLQTELGTEQTVVNRQFCMKTYDGRWAYVKIIGLDPGRGTITLHIVVYTLETE
jgi:hypothetical protein